MKNSIGLKLFIGITCFALIIVGLSWILNTKYLERYYLEKKKDKLVEYSEDILGIYGGNIDDIEDTLKDIESKIGGNIIIFDINGTEIYNSSFMRGRGGRGRGSIKGIDLLRGDEFKEILNGKVVLGSYTHPRFNSMSLVLALLLKNNHILILEAPVASIKESVEIAKDFYIYIGLISLVIGTIIAFIFSKIFTRPITRLNDVAKSMARLDFSQKYIIRGNDEIDQLGRTINFLSDKLDASISQLNSANKKLREDIEKERQMESLRKEFVSSVSHELKTPIALIQGYGEGLRDAVIQDEESKNFYCDVIVDEAKKMDTLVKDLLNLSQLESGHYRLQRESFNIYDLTKGIVDKYIPILDEKNILLKINSDDKGMKVCADISRIEQVLINFINNAIDHVDDEKAVSINIKDYMERVKIEVINTGKPIPEGEIDRIWNSFYKVDKSRTRKYGGTGLGLSIVKGILKLHNSSFGVFNVDKGVKFWFELDKGM